MERKHSKIDHIFHVWMNQRQMARPQGEVFEHDLYEWKSAINEMHRLPQWLKAARTNSLRLVHQQCSFSVPEKIEKNRLVCAMGVDVTECAILRSLYETFGKEAEREYYSDVSVDDADTVAAQVCCWHIFMDTVRRPHAIDTSEGYMKDESDRRFWGTVYKHLSAGCDEEDEAPQAEGREGE